jgi:UDP-N-acetylglucosamine 2-epimerase (non-hydrolysing)
MSATKVLAVYGTRPEAIKMAPLVAELRASPQVDVVVAVTGQHRQMLDPVNELFGIVPRHDLGIIAPRQTLTDITSRCLLGLDAVLAAERPDAVVVQGDTSSAFAAALSAFYAQVPVVHLEAGLRTHDRYSPFPEELNRRLTAQLSTLHLAPTPGARDNLLREGIGPTDVVVTGNTVIDALLAVVAQRPPYRAPGLEAHVAGHRVVLVTAHRRESWGLPMARIGRAIGRLAVAEPDVRFVLPAHRNPTVREALLPPLRGLDNVLVCDPVGYGELARLLADCHLVLTDSGGIQEEAPSLGKPVLVMRESSERPEALRVGAARLVGTSDEVIVEEVTTLLHDAQAYAAMSRAISPYGDGRAAPRAARAIEALLGVGRRIPDFQPEPELVAHELIEEVSL